MQIDIIIVQGLFRITGSDIVWILTIHSYKCSSLAVPFPDFKLKMGLGMRLGIHTSNNLEFTVQKIIYKHG